MPLLHTLGCIGLCRVVEFYSRDPDLDLFEEVVHDLVIERQLAWDNVGHSISLFSPASNATKCIQKPGGKAHHWFFFESEPVLPWWSPDVNTCFDLFHFFLLKITKNVEGFSILSFWASSDVIFWKPSHSNHNKTKLCQQAFFTHILSMTNGRGKNTQLKTTFQSDESAGMRPNC